MGSALVSSLVIAGLSCSYFPEGEDLNPAGVLVADHFDYIEMSPESGVVFEPGLMFWPGGLVDPHAYRASLGPLAARGFRVVIVKVPANLAVLSIDKGRKVAERLGGRWAASGHSLGGAMAAWTVHDHPQAFQALILMAAYPADTKSLAEWEGPVISIYGEHDGLAGPEVIESKMGLLPPAHELGDDDAPVAMPGRTVYQEIYGGNHAQFGAYGPQEGDRDALIRPQLQHQIMANVIESFLQGLE